MNFFKRPVILDNRSIGLAILGALIGMLFFLSCSFASKAAFHKLNDWQSQCMRTYLEAVSSLPIDQQQNPQESGCLSASRGFQFAFFQAGWFGPPILGALIIPIKGVWPFVQSYYLIVSSVIYALIGAYCMARYHPKKAVSAFLLAYIAITYSITIYTFVLGLIINRNS
jgi:hypothetical protein